MKKEKENLLPAHKIAKSIFPAFPAFHAFTGCDTISSFLGCGKKSAWQAWGQFPDLTNVFKCLSNLDIAVVNNEMEILEEYTVSLCSKKLETKCVNEEARELLFSQGKDLLRIYHRKKMLWSSMYRGRPIKQVLYGDRTDPESPS